MRVVGILTGRAARGVAALLLLALVTACAGNSAYRKGERALNRQNWDEAVLYLSKAVALDPSNSRAVMWLQRAKLKASADHFVKGTQYANSNQRELAIVAEKRLIGGFIQINYRQAPMSKTAIK